MLGLLYGRYLNRPEDALKQLKTAIDRLTDPGQKNMCQQEIKRLEKIHVPGLTLDALAEIGGETAARLLETALDDPDESLREDAADALEDIGAEQPTGL